MANASATLTPISIAPCPLSQVRLLDGIFKQRQDTHARFLMMIEPDRLLAPFRRQAGLTQKAQNYGGWESRDIAGHSLGHYLSALALHFASTGDEQVRERINFVVDELAAAQQANGDGYVLPVDKNAFESLREGKMSVSPFALNGVWVPFYTQHKVFAGLRDAFHLAGNTRALEVERNIADWLDGILSGSSREQIQEMLRCEHGGMNEVLADLGADTGDERYLHMAAKYFHHEAVLDPMLRGEDNLNGLHGNTQIPKVVGLAREYELTAEPAYRIAAETFWDNVVNRRSYAIGGHGESEHFFPPEKFADKLTPFACETCNTYNMLKLTKHLFAWEPKAQRMDFVERAMINHLAANIGRGPGEFGYFVGLGSVAVKVFSTPFDSWWCCVGTGLENPPRYGELIYYQSPQTLWVNLYVGSRLTCPQTGVELTQETRFPDEETVRFSVNCQAPQRFALKCRHPYWCEKPEAKVNGQPVPVESLPSSYITFDRIWKSGDTLELGLPMALRAEPLPHADDRILAVMYGPTVLAGIVADQPDIHNPSKQRFSDHLQARGKTDAFPPVLVAPSAADVLSHLIPTGNAFAEFRSDGVVRPDDLTFVPFYRIYEQQYAVYFPLMTQAQWTHRKEDLRAQKDQQMRAEAATVDSVTPGYQQPEVEHGLRFENSEVSDFQDRKSRLARDGWFSYDMAVESAAPMALIATYWGAEWGGRTFDILIDREKIATQTLHANRPGDFFEETYPIPNVLTRGKSKVTVRFQSQPRGTAGRLFGLRMMRCDGPPTI